MKLLRYIRKVVAVVVLAVRSQINLTHCPKRFRILDGKASLYVWL